MIDAPGHAIVDQQARLVAARLWPLRNKLRRKVVVQLVDPHPQPNLPLPRIDERAVVRAQERLEQRAEVAALGGVLERTRERLEELVSAAETAATDVPFRVETAVREQALPVGRNLAEIRGLMNQVIRRLDALEAGAADDRNARVDDLALLVDLISAGWSGVDERLARLEAAVARLAPSGGATVHRLDAHRA